MDLLINMDSQAPNKVVGEWLLAKEPFGKVKLLKPECTYGSSRFDFYLETETEKIFIEVKGVTLEEDGIVRFPDAPTERGVKHLEELCACVEAGYKAAVIFVVQMEGMQHFEPNDKTHPQFGEALRQARKAGVEVLAYECKVTPSSLEITKSIPIVL
ncbi:MAG: DNA/RNA nuclease SfsA [Phascolarctobacterium sp.]|nr:DNA/RNA nuclease SfsA [Phascolarctobacterium sp.]